jgi:hypothetical protein
MPITIAFRDCAKHSLTKPWGGRAPQHPAGTVRPEPAGTRVEARYLRDYFSSAPSTSVQ